MSRRGFFDHSEYCLCSLETKLFIKCLPKRKISVDILDWEVDEVLNGFALGKVRGDEAERRPMNWLCDLDLGLNRLIRSAGILEAQQILTEIESPSIYEMILELRRALHKKTVSLIHNQSSGT